MKTSKTNVTYEMPRVEVINLSSEQAFLAESENGGTAGGGTDSGSSENWSFSIWESAK